MVMLMVVLKLINFFRSFGGSKLVALLPEPKQFTRPSLRYNTVKCSWCVYRGKKQFPRKTLQYAYAWGFTVVRGEGAVYYERGAPVLCVWGERISDSSCRPQKGGGLVVDFGLDWNLDRIGKSRKSKAKSFLPLCNIHAIPHMGVMTKYHLPPMR